MGILIKKMTRNIDLRGALMLRRGWKVLFPLILIVAPLAIEALYISRFSVNVPFWDEWAIVPILKVLFQQDASRLFVALWSQHNEHRMLFPKLIFWALAKISNWNLVVEMYFSLFLASLSLVGLYLIYKKARCGSLWGFVPIAWLLFSLGQWENILWGSEIVFYLQVLGVILGIYFLSAKSLWYLGVAAVCGIVASFSASSGLLIWPVGLLCCVALRVERKQLILWSLVGTLVVTAYFTGYVPPASHPSLMSVFHLPATTVVFFLANIGAPLGGGDLNLSSVMGAGLLLLLLAFASPKLWAIGRVQVSESGILLGSLVVFSLLASAMITVGRVGFDQLDRAISSRYTTITTLGIAGLYMLFIKRSLSNETQYDSDRLGHAVFPALLPVLLVGLAVTNLYGIRMGEGVYVGRLRMKYALQTFETQPDDVLNTLYPSPATVRERAGFLKENRLSAFSEPVNVLLLTSSKKAVPAGEILPDRPVVQSFRCSVRTLNDVEIRFATYARNNTSRVEIALAEGDKPLLQQSLSSAEIKDNSWVPLVLPKPIQDCKGRDLVLRVSSQDASPGNAVTIWTYPRYYEGDLLEPKDESLVDRVIGLELNAVFYGLVQ